MGPTGSDGAVITAELPGFAAESFDVSVFGKTVTVKGERKALELEGATAHRRERQVGSFVRAIELPFRIEADKVDAKYERGVLQITLPRAEADRTWRKGTPAYDERGISDGFVGVDGRAFSQACEPAHRRGVASRADRS